MAHTLFLFAIVVMLWGFICALVGYNPDTKDYCRDPKEYLLNFCKCLALYVCGGLGFMVVYGRCFGWPVAE